MTQKSSVALGFFDGVHLAHQKIISAAAAKKGLRPVALTFDAPPVQILRGEPTAVLTDNAEKQRLIAELGAECVLLKTTKELLSMSGREFAEKILSGKMKAAHCVCGFNYTFGSDRLGGKELTELGKELGFSVEILEEERLDGEIISSSRIRNLLAGGDMPAAAALLGRPYSVSGVVEQGKRLGRTMGFPTINIYPAVRRAEMPYGVYAARVAFGGEEHIGVTNVGVNPTVGDGSLRIETHIPDFNADLYGESVEIRFLRFVRPERKFSSVEELFAQIRRDTENVLKELTK